MDISNRAEILIKAPEICHPQKVMSRRDAAMSERETLPLQEGLNRTLAISGIGCPPAVPIITGGEKIDKKCMEAFEYYSIKECTVTK